MKIQRFIAQKFCKTYLKALLEELGNKNSQIANLKAINQTLRENNNQLQLTIKGIIKGIAKI